MFFRHIESPSSSRLCRIDELPERAYRKSIRTKPVQELVVIVRDAMEIALSGLQAGLKPGYR